MINSEIPPVPTPDHSSEGEVNLIGLLIGFLSVGLVLFAGLSIYAFSTARVATTTLDQQKAAAVKVAVEEQQKKDAEAHRIAMQSPFRSYTSPTEFGAFTIQLPKNWSGSVVHNRDSETQVNLVLNPEFIYTTGSQAEPVATKIVLVQRLSTDLARKYKERLKKGSMKSEAITVSGISGTAFTGTFDDKRTQKLVMVPVRDKTIVLSTENKAYLKEFDEILAQAKINP